MRKRTRVDDGSADGEEQELGGHRCVERLGEVLGLGHVSDERRDEGLSDNCRRKDDRSASRTVRGRRLRKGEGG